ncbi:seipin isoform X1 [Salmo trutta]|uniref:seipin isoform X1 n=1 Tax=Salmo trutta TaxID=8032 RepID=UPI0011326651|nr:seipin-like isoform X1 [Salmo trutta]XP_029580428.1 seipin-like isoform X1 [Salmo trutta]
MDTGTEPMGTGGHHESGDPVGPALLWLRDTVTTVTLQARQRVLQGALLLCALGLLLWTAIFLYGSFYYSYMPLATYSTPVHYYYRTDCDSSASLLCSFPTANVSLLRNGKNQVMTYGQPYRISLELEMPESPANQELGMFMVKMFCYSRQGQTVTSSARSVRQLSSSSRFTMLRYRSGLLQTLGTLFLIPFFLSGTADQKQLVEVELFSEYREDSYAPSIGAIIEIQSQRVQIYSANLYIHAHFTGIRYFLYNFPTLSAVMGVASNLSFLSVLLLFSYLRLIWGRFIDPQKVRDRIHLHQRLAGMDESKDTELLQDNQDDTTGIENSSSDALLEAHQITATHLNQKEESILKADGGEMDIRHGRFQSEIDEEEIIAEEEVENMGMSVDPELEGSSETAKQPDSIPSTLIGTSTCVIS